MWLVGRGGIPGAGKRRMTCPHVGIDSGGAKAAANLCKGTGPRRARQAHRQLSAGGAGWPGRALLACSSAGGTGVGPDRAEDSEEYLIRRIRAHAKNTVTDSLRASLVASGAQPTFF